MNNEFFKSEFLIIRITKKMKKDLEKLKRNRELKEKDFFSFSGLAREALQKYIDKYKIETNIIARR